MSMRIYVPCDSSALAVGAERIANTILAEAKLRGMDVTLVRNGTRGMMWLEPLVEVETAQGRIGFGPVRLPMYRACSMRCSIRARILLPSGLSMSCHG